ncbi:MAG: 5-oxoprolinase subunit PxpB [Saprospiraceae bacterium]|nr:5-oxoprolinase subunit PxpB [Saprospiraceae bacterium]
MTFYPLGDTAIIINFEQKIQKEINFEVLQLTNYLKSKKTEGVIFYVPAYCSLTIGYDPEKWNYQDLIERITRFIDKLPVKKAVATGRRWKIPVCYNELFGLDLKELAFEKKVTINQIIEWHLSQTYHVYMLGFLPGFVYLGDLPEPLSCRRKEHPRITVPSQSVGLAGRQTGIYPLDAPSGWQIIGKTPIRIFNPAAEDPFLFKMGDQVTFSAINKEEFVSMENDDPIVTSKKCLINE